MLAMERRIRAQANPSRNATSDHIWESRNATPPPAQGKASSGSPSELEAEMDEYFCVHVCRGRTGNLYLDTFKVVDCGRGLGLSTPTPCDACANQETSLANILHCHYSGQLVYFRIELVEVD